MWISRSEYTVLVREAASSTQVALDMEGVLKTRITDLERMNTRLQGDLDWAKHRLNQVEKERAQLIAAAIGVKISVPEFQPRMDNPEDALNQMPDLSMVGADAKEEGVIPTLEFPEQQAVTDWSMMPGYRRTDR